MYKSTPKFPRPCTLACNCNIIWVSDSGQVGGWSRKFRNHTGREAFEKIMLNFTKNTLTERRSLNHTQLHSWLNFKGISHIKLKRISILEDS